MQTKARDNLSDFWRRDRSDDRTRELVSVLQGADVLIGNMGSDIRVTWSGGDTSHTDLSRKVVALDYAPLQGQNLPFPGATVDEVVGYAAHEGGHCLWSRPGKEQLLTNKLADNWDTLPQQLRHDLEMDEFAAITEVCRIQNALEDAYIDHAIAAKWPVLGKYVRISRRRLFRKSPIDLAAVARSLEPDRNAVINLWVSISLYHRGMPPETSEPVRKALIRLLGLSRKAMEEEDAARRQALAFPAAVVLWQSFPVKEAALPVRPAADTGQQEPGTEDGPAATPQGPVQNLDDFDPSYGERTGGRQVVTVSQKLLDDMTETVANTVEDLTSLVVQVLGEAPGNMAARVKRATYDAGAARTAIDQSGRAIRDVQEAFRRQQGEHSRWLKGLDRGRVDTKRLWRTQVPDPHIYKRRDVLGAPRLAVGLLLDVSGSMRKSMETVWRTAAVFSQGLARVPGVNFTILGYTGEAGRVALTRICDRNSPRLCLGGVEQGRSTPSGAAIAATKVLLERMPERQRLLVHFTDGRADDPEHLARAMKACQKAGIGVYTIGLADNAKELNRQLGVGKYEVIRQVSDLPHAVARIVQDLSRPHTFIAGNVA